MTETSMDMDQKTQQFDEDVQKVLDLLQEKSYFKARDEILKHNEVDISEILEEVLEELGLEKTIIIFRMLPKDVSVEVFSYLPSDDQVAIVQGITDREISYIIEELDFDDKIDVLEELPANIVDKILEKTPKEERRLINTFLNYPDTCAGSLMISDDDMKIADLMSTEYVYVNVYDDQEEVAETFKKYGFLAIPVVDNEHRLVGIITFDDILEVIEEETTEDIQRMAGVIDDSDTEYLDMGIFRHVRNRLPWLVFMNISAMITGTIILRFEAVLAQVIVLVSYLPLLMGTGGNTGSQAATLVIRGMAIDEIELKDVLKVFWKEFRVSLILGVLLSIFNMAKVVFIDGESILIGLTVALSMTVIVIFAKLLGSMLPMAAKKLGVDPALMANPMISSFTDMFSSVTFLLVASLLLGITL